jgi:3-isopropylmalate dehydrogenase
VHPNIPDGFRIDVVRENCGGLYKGIGGKRKNKKGEIEYFQEMNYTPREMRRILEWAFDYTKKRSDREGIDRKLTFAHKGNVVTHVFDPMREIYKELQAANPYVKSDDGYIDAGCGPWLLGNPQGLDVLVTTNMFGDIITDEQAEWFGGMGGAGSTNKNPNGISLYEPVHGSAPQFAGKNVLSPIAAMMSGVMMLADLGERAAADRIYKGIWNSFKNKKITNTTVNSGVPTDQQTKFVLEEMARVV